MFIHFVYNPILYNIYIHTYIYIYVAYLYSNYCCIFGILTAFSPGTKLVWMLLSGRQSISMDSFGSYSNCRSLPVAAWPHPFPMQSCLSDNVNPAAHGIPAACGHSNISRKWSLWHFMVTLNSSNDWKLGSLRNFGVLQVGGPLAFNGPTFVFGLGFRMREHSRYM